jgi:hypothetical protein
MTAGPNEAFRAAEGRYWRKGRSTRSSRLYQVRRPAMRLVSRRCGDSAAGVVLRCAAITCRHRKGRSLFVGVGGAIV